MRSTDVLSYPDAQRAVIALPFGRMRLTCTADAVLLLDYLAPDAPLIPPQSALCREVASQLHAYCADPSHVFSLPLADSGTAFQRRVWALLQQIPCGQTRTYGDAAVELRSAARAVGQACAANPFAPVVPCHRIVARHGLGGFAHSSDGNGHLLGIKRWLLRHEGTCHHA
jgi:methylated-DNA-[protein]-cysteine S-methyltransferase